MILYQWQYIYIFSPCEISTKSLLAETESEMILSPMAYISLSFCRISLLYYPIASCHYLVLPLPFFFPPPVFFSHILSFCSIDPIFTIPLPFYLSSFQIAIAYSNHFERQTCNTLFVPQNMRNILFI